MWIVLPSVIAIRGLVWVASVDDTERWYVVLSHHVVVGRERGRVRAGQRSCHVELVLERHPDQQVFVTTSW